jgi:hypothetical protein
MSTHCFVKRFLDDLALIPKPVTHARAPIQATAPKWIPPSDGLVKANVDGAVSRNDVKGSSAVVFRNNLGQYLGSSTMMFLGVTDPASLEVLACREALSLVADLSCQRIHFASDCKQVISDIAENTGGQYVTIV